MRFSFGLLLGVTLCAGLVVPAAAQEDKVAKQKQTAQEMWKGLLDGESPRIEETEHFLLIGTIDEKTMERVGKAAEKHLPQIMKSLRFEEDEDQHLLWEGKLTMHLCKDRMQFRSLYTKMKRDRPLDDEVSTYHHEGVYSHLLVGPPSVGKSTVPVEIEVIGQLGTATLTRKRTARLPPWLLAGYGRAHAYRYNPRLFVWERQLAYAMLAKGKTVGDMYNESDLGPAAVAILRGSFVDFLAHSPQMAPYWPKVLLKIDDVTSLEQIWEELRIKGEDVQKHWAAWSRSPR